MKTSTILKVNFLVMAFILTIMFMSMIKKNGLSQQFQVLMGIGSNSSEMSRPASQ